MKLGSEAIFDAYRLIYGSLNLGAHGAHEITHLLSNPSIQLPWQSIKLFARIWFPQTLASLGISSNFSSRELE